MLVSTGWALRVLSALLGARSATADRASHVDQPEFDWNSISPSSDLKYFPCYEQYQCARLTVPLDWQDAENNHTVALAIIKLPAEVADDDPSFGGSLFTNPGGPGGSGVSFVLSEGRKLQQIVDGNKHYEILSWDPRGVWLSTPRVDCFGDAVSRELFTLRKQVMGPLDAGRDALRRHFAVTQGQGELCAKGLDAHPESILPFLSTPYVARDIVEMVDRIHELREQEADERRNGDNESPSDVGGAGDVTSQKTMLERSVEAPRLKYWGFSYGSVLGNTFASMYPGRVGRLMLDGVVDAEDFMLGRWSKNLQDAEELINFFYERCFAANDKCALRRPSDTKPEDMRQRVEDLAVRTDAEPVAVLHDRTTFVITGTDVRDLFRAPLYNPLTDFDPLATTLNDALNGNFTLLLQKSSAASDALAEACTAPVNGSATGVKVTPDAAIAITCGDGREATEITVPSFERYIEELKAQSPTLANSWASIRFSCSGWKVHPTWRYTGPFTTPKPDNRSLPGRPAAPALFLSSRLDPVTPLRNAFAMSADHPGSAVVVQNSTGHCTIAAPSRCKNKIVRHYLEHGEVPGSGTVCEADCEPWQDCSADPFTMSLGCGKSSEHRRHFPLGI